MDLEFRELGGVRMTFVSGKAEPVWLVAFLVKKLGHIPRAARRLRWNRRLVRAALSHAEWNPTTMAQERTAALAAGFRSDLLMDSPKALVFPSSELRNRPSRSKRDHLSRRVFPEARPLKNSLNRVKIGPDSADDPGCSPKDAA